MYSLRFNQLTGKGYRGLVFDRIPVRDRSGKLTERYVIGICADFQVKDELKAFCKEHGGTWESIERYWYFPIEIKKGDSPESVIWQACKAVIDEFANYISMGGIHLAIEVSMPDEAKQKLISGINKLIEIENGVPQPASDAAVLGGNNPPKPQLSKLVWVDDVVEEYAHEGWGDEGHYEATAAIAGKKVKVEVWEEKPRDYDSWQKSAMGNEYRHLLSEDGKRYWCRPMDGNLSRYEFGFWPDAKLD